MLVECGFVRVQSGAGQEWTFCPSLGRIAALGSPTEVVDLYAQLHDAARAAQAARYVLAVMCEQDDPTPVVGWHDADTMTEQPGAMPAGEQIVIARHLMLHGMVGQARPMGAGAAQGQYTDRFDAAEYVALARTHLGLSSADAEALSMTELQRMLAMKFPELNRGSSVPSREKYAEAIAAIEKVKKKGAGRGA